MVTGFSIKNILFTILFLFISSSVFSDKIYLKNGDIVKGRIIKQNQKIIIIKTEFGNMKYSKININNIKYEAPDNDNPVNVFTYKGAIYRGKLVEQDEKIIKIKTAKGIFIINKEDIEQVNWNKKIIYPEEQYKDLRFPSLWRSTLLPSWGQFYQGKKKKGKIIAISMGVLLISTIITKIEYNKYYNNYKKLPYDDVSLRNKADNWRMAYNTLLVTTISGWILNAIDAVIFAPKPVKRKYKIIGLKPEIRFGYTGIACSGKF